MDTRKQRQIVREQLQSMKDDWMKEMKIMMKEEIKIEQYSFKEAVRSIKTFKLEFNKAVDFTNETFTILCMKIKNRRLACC